MDHVCGLLNRVCEGGLVEDVSFNDVKVLEQISERLLDWVHLRGIALVSDSSTNTETSIFEEVKTGLRSKETSNASDSHKRLLICLFNHKEKILKNRF